MKNYSKCEKPEKEMLDNQICLKQSIWDFKTCTVDKSKCKAYEKREHS